MKQYIITMLITLSCASSYASETAYLPEGGNYTQVNEQDVCSRLQAGPSINNNNNPQQGIMRTPRTVKLYVVSLKNPQLPEHKPLTLKLRAAGKRLKSIICCHKEPAIKDEDLLMP